MPPVRRTRERPSQESSSDAVDTLGSLRQQCADKGLPIHGRRNALGPVYTSAHG